MTDGRTNSDIRKEQKVGIETKRDQGTGRLTTGTVKRILTSSKFHPHGIKVELDGGHIGRVKRILDADAHGNGGITDMPPHSDLDKMLIPQSEDKHNEFKEFYQYDKSMEEIPASVPKGQRMEIIEKKKRPGRERIAVAVCSLGNDRDGGFVYLGVRDDGIVAGLERDKEIGSFADYNDKFANHIYDTLTGILQDRVFVLNKVDIGFTEREGKAICIVSVRPASKPLYVHHEKDAYLYVRGNASRAVRLRGLEMFEYNRERFRD